MLAGDRLDPVEGGVGQAETRAVAGDDGAAELAAEEVADVVAEDRGEEGGGSDGVDVELALAAAVAASITADSPGSGAPSASSATDMKRAAIPYCEISVSR